MNEEIKEILKEFEEKRVEQLPENTKRLFYSIMNIADERDRLKEIIDKAIEKLYCWGEVLDPDFQKEMLDILKGSDE